MTVKTSQESTNPYLESNFAPVHEEVELALEVIDGDIPESLLGCFLRIGPNPQFIVDAARYHWFDGDGMIHEIEFKSGAALYRNRWVRTQGFKVEAEAGKGLWKGINSPPDFTNPHGPMKNPANTAFVWHNKRLLALWEGGEPHEVKLPTLETVGVYNFSNGLAGYPYSAHPKVDPETGEMMACGYFMVASPFVKHFVIDRAGQVIKATPIAIPKGVLMHDCAITQHYTLVLDLPLCFDLQRAMQGKPPIQWEPENGARIGVLPRHGDGKDIRWFSVSPGMVFHVMNAFEEGDEVVLDACRSDHTTMLQQAAEPDKDQAYPYRWRLNLKTGEVTEGRFSEVRCEFPRINESRMGRPYRYCWASRFANSPLPLFDAFVKFDRELGTEQIYPLGPDRFMGEAIFAPRPGAVAEDDGWVIGYVRDEAQAVSECWILDARDISRGPIARISLPVRVPYGFHAGWVSGHQLAGGG